MLTKGERSRGPHGMMAPARNLSLYLLLAALHGCTGANSAKPNCSRTEEAALAAVVFQDVFGLTPQLICVTNNERVTSDG
jgi:hypothetical protein